MRVLIRADASMRIGSGHIARCLTLAAVLRERGAEVAFACRLLPGQLLARIEGQGFKAYALPGFYAQEQDEGDIEALLPWQADIDALRDALGEEDRFDWLIVDHYALDRDWQTAARAFAKRIMAIDDLANRPHAVDLLLDQNFSAQPQAYAPWIDSQCLTLFGPHYALLRDEFQRPPIEIRPRVRRVIVNFGGFDAAEQTYNAMLALTTFSELEVDFVAGVDNPAWAAMQVLAAAHGNWRLHTLVDDFAGLMAQADLFIGAGGGTTWERAALGLPTLCISVASNQELNARLLADAGGHLYLGAHEQVSSEALRQAVQALCMSGQGVRQRMAGKSRELVDGKGAQRVADALFNFQRVTHNE